MKPRRRSRARTVAFILCITGLAVASHVEATAVGGMEWVEIHGFMDARTLYAQSDHGPEIIKINGLRQDDACAPKDQPLWMKTIFTPTKKVYRSTKDGVSFVAFAWQGHWVDFAFVALRTGHGQRAPTGDPGLDQAYARAELDAQTEYRGRWGSCGSPASPFRRTEAASGFPAEVLYGIAMNETGRAGHPWPWTLNVDGRPYYFRDREAAWRGATYLTRQGRDDFDIGMMQVNWHYHQRRFRDPWEALDPLINQRVAAAILAENLRRSGSLRDAIKRYHSSDPRRGDAYYRRFEKSYARAIAGTGSAPVLASGSESPQR